MNQRPVPGAEQPHSEPEIIPPGEAGLPPRGAGARPSFDGRGTQRIYVARVGPFGFALMALVAALFAALVLFVVLGAFVILIPLAGVLLAIAIVVTLLRAFSRHR